ncbi:Sel1 repeat protein [compost metagenome]
MALATNYFTGRGVPRDYGKAFTWYSRAATAGDGGAQYIVGSYYERGEPGVVDKDIEQAKIWYARAAAGGDPGALAKLRSLLEEGLRAKSGGPM